MKGKLFQPVVFNVITIVAMLFSLFQIVAGGVDRTTRTAQAIQLLEELVEEGVIEDEGIVSGVATDQSMRASLATTLYLTMLIAIVANVIANYLGRGRHHENLSRIRELEAELRGRQEA